MKLSDAQYISKLEKQVSALKRENEEHLEISGEWQVIALGLGGVVRAYHPEYFKRCDCPQCGDAAIRIDALLAAEEGG